MPAYELSAPYTPKGDQPTAIAKLVEGVNGGERYQTLLGATGTGKTRTAIALVDLLQRANWVKRTLFLADRISLVKQAVGAFKSHLPDSSPVNLITEKEAEGRVYASTYPTMLSLINQRDREGKGRFGPGGEKGAAGNGQKAKWAPPRASEAPRGGAPLIFGGGKVYPGR